MTIFRSKSQNIQSKLTFIERIRLYIGIGSYAGEVERLLVILSVTMFFISKTNTQEFKMAAQIIGERTPSKHLSVIVLKILNRTLKEYKVNNELYLENFHKMLDIISRNIQLFRIVEQMLLSDGEVGNKERELRDKIKTHYNLRWNIR